MTARIRTTGAVCGVLVLLADAATAQPVPVLPTGGPTTALQMFLQADAIVKSVMLLLLLASVVTWSIWAAKSREIVGVKRGLVADLARLKEARDLEKAVVEGEVAAGLLDVARREVKAAVDLSNTASAEAMKERLAVRLHDAEQSSVQRVLAGINILASIGATAPFVGLFGTVWGIMNSFIGISKAQTTNLAVVAPGIAEALLATALGLVAAIPAVLIYNIFARSIAGYRRLLAETATEIACLVSHEVERAQVGKAA